MLRAVLIRLPAVLACLWQLQSHTRVVSIAAMVRLVAQERSSEAPRILTISQIPLEHIDLRTLGIHPAVTLDFNRSSLSPLVAAVGKRGAFMSVGPNIVDQNGVAATVLANMTPGESVSYFVNHVAAGTFTADQNGRLALSVGANDGFGFYVVEAVGAASLKHAGCVFHAAPTGPYVPGVAVAPHAINPTGTSTITMFAGGYEPSVPVTFYRDGSPIGSAITDPGGRVAVNVVVPVPPCCGSRDTAVYSVDSAAPGSMAGQSIEERHDAGQPPVGDQNRLRAFISRAVINSTSRNTLGAVGEGFHGGDRVFGSGVGNAACLFSVRGDEASVNGSLGKTVWWYGGSGIGGCNFGAATAKMLAHPNAANVRSMIVEPSAVASGGRFIVAIFGLPPGDVGTVSLDGVPQTTATVYSDGFAIAGLQAPTRHTGLVHQVGWVGHDGVSDAQSTAILVFGAQDDFDRDAVTDRTVFTPSTGNWMTAYSGGGAATSRWGCFNGFCGSDIDVLDDYDGDGIADLAFWRPSDGHWFIAYSGKSSFFWLDSPWGMAGDIPLSGNIYGGAAIPVIYRGGDWFFFSQGYLRGGAATDVPLLADYDGDGKADPTVFRPSTGVWYSYGSRGASLVTQWGIEGDVPIAGDWDGDGIADRAVFRPGTGEWFVLKSSGGAIVTRWGTSADIPISGDFDADGMSDFTVWRPTTGEWFTLLATGGVQVATWGGPGDRPSGRPPAYNP